jgi:hypothetical protein
MTDNQKQEADSREMTENEQKLVAWVVEHTDRWRDYRDNNFKEAWLEYERIFRGQWAAEDKQRDSERSRFISPATQQAVETRHAEIMEAAFGDGEFFDIKDDVADPQKEDVALLKEQLHEDMLQDGIRKSTDAIVLLAELYGTGIGEILVEEKTTYAPATQPIPGAGIAAIGVMEGKRFCVPVTPVNPKNFLIDPNGETVDDGLGCAVEKSTSIHKVVKKIEEGVYKKRAVESLYTTNDLEPTQENTNADDGNCVVMRYYGLVPRHLLQEEGTEAVELFPEDSGAADSEKYSDLVEALVVIANGSVLLKAEENPYMMKDRPIVAYQADTVPGRFWGRGTVEKAYNSQKAIDGTLRADADSRALTSAPMVAMDATRLPRGMKYEVKAGKSILTNGNPSEILMPFNFGQHRPDNAVAAQNFERMLLQATGTQDAAAMTGVVRDGESPDAPSVIIKKYKRTLTNFQEQFMIPLVNKTAWRRMQFEPDRYPAVDVKFTSTGALGIIAREQEQKNSINLLKTLGPDTPMLPILMKSVIENSGSSKKAEMLAAIDQMLQPNPEQQAAQAQMQQLQMAEQLAKVKKLEAEAEKAAVEAKIAPTVAQAKVIAALSNNLDDDAEGKDFERRVRLAELLLQEKDIDSNREIAELQMANKQVTE